MSTPRTIKTLEDYGISLDGDVVARGTAAVPGCTGNSRFPNPPVDLSVLKSDIDSFSALIAEALDGSKKVIAEKNKQRHVVIKMLRLLRRYVEVNCEDDMADFKSSGFEPASTTRTPTQQLSQNIGKIDHGANTGQVVVQLKAVPKTASYDLRYAVAVSGGTPGAWTTEVVTGARPPVTINGLTPGTTYAFQVRTLSKSGYSDWSDSVTFMCA